jgi:hypothetical protein
MKFSYAVAVFIGVASAGEPVWSLRSVNDHRTDSTIQAAYADHSTTQANGRPPYQSAAQLNESESDSDSSDDEESLLMTQGDYFKPGFSGAIGAAAYDREPRMPAHFASDDDDIFMRSMIENYALEEKTAEDKATGYKGGEPTGKFWMDEFAAKAAAQEVLCTHKSICGGDLATYLDSYFQKAWGHFDVNRTGYIEVIKMPSFIRFLASDQYFQFIQPK